MVLSSRMIALMDQPELQRAILKLVKLTGIVNIRELSHPGGNAAVRRRFQAAGIACDAEWFEINEAMWGLVARRLAWISVYETSSPQWVLNLTERGSVIA